MDDETLFRLFDNEQRGKQVRLLPSSGTLYREAGEADFYCPTLWEIRQHRHHDDLTLEEKYGPAMDGQGHSAWHFSWAAGAYHIEHEANGGVPQCPKCGQKMIFIGGDHPGHKESE